MGERTYLTLGNHTGIDIHIEITGDVHTGHWGPHQVNNNHSPQVKSRKVAFGNRARYDIKVWKNDNGQPGTFIGSFSHHVRYNLAGNRDHLEFIITNINGNSYMRVLSLRESGEEVIKFLLGSIGVERHLSPLGTDRSIKNREEILEVLKGIQKKLNELTDHLVYNETEYMEEREYEN
ncbi:hypothetical protein [Halalkalibacter krulwichiae]|nr:hypothetical protein [Halalkalibacter krulwichiae]